MARSQTRKDSLLTYEAKKALDALTEPLWAFTIALDRLEENDLVSLAAESRKRAQASRFPDLHTAIAEAADIELVLLEARRTPTGVWHAILDVIRWDERKDYGEGIATYHEECAGRDVAVLAARKLLIDHASEFNESTTLEVRIVPDFERHMELKESEHF